MKKKLLIFHPIIAPYRIDMFNALSDHYNVKICLFWRNLKDQTFDYAKIEEQFRFKPEYVVREEMRFGSWLKTLWHQLSSFQADIVLVSEYGIPTILTVMHRMITRKKYKIISIVDDSYNMVSNNNQFTRRHRKAMQIITPRLDEVVNVEPRVAAWYQYHYHKGFYFPIICDDRIARQRLQRILPISERLIKEYRLEGKKVMLFVGRLVALKNLPFAINAFISASIPDSTFVIVGDGPERENLVKLANGRDNILFVGRHEGDELYAWYNVAQVFTLQSTQEPFGAVSNEALVGGCKILVSKNAGSNCLVKEGENGYVIDPRDEQGFIEKLDSIMDSSLPISTPLSLRESEMKETFAENIERLLNLLDSL